MARTQVQVPSLTSLCLWTSHPLASGLKRLGDISGSCGCKTKIKFEKPVTVPPTPGRHGLCGPGGILRSHQDLRRCSSLHFSVSSMPYAVSQDRFASPEVCLSHSPLAASSPVFSENGPLESGDHPWFNWWPLWPNKSLVLFASRRGFRHGHQPEHESRREAGTVTPEIKEHPRSNLNLRL